ncbi:RluA family pseudouridine synthase [Treponema pectinovorum]|uniref:RluA family pseudouridine synthase n=1 Tax=Treponema pectinovorum TaxID=164 RepID=UPI0011F2B0C9|nr:RNA pseudouridine synthase [Treponema pectinovorum]
MKKTQIVYENQEILVINKEAGISVQGGEKIAHPLDEELSKQLGYKVFLVHRLDKETSGLMIVAKSSESASKWISLISSKKVKKEYTAICFFEPVIDGKKSSEGKITDSIEKSGKTLTAQTNFKLFASKEISLDDESVKISALHLTLGSGRMHQIRIHLAKAGCPIVQDDKHGNFKLNKKVRALGIKKLCLASTKLTIPNEKENLVFEIELPEHMKTALALLT